MTRPDRALETEVIGRAQGRCEYCHFPESAAELPFHIDQIIGESTVLKRNEPFKRQRPRQRLMALSGGKKVTDVSGHPGGVMVRVNPEIRRFD